MGFTIEGRPAGQGRLDVPRLLGELRRYGRDPRGQESSTGYNPCILIAEDLVLRFRESARFPESFAAQYPSLGLRPSQRPPGPRINRAREAK